MIATIIFYGLIFILGVFIGIILFGKYSYNLGYEHGKTGRKKLLWFKKEKNHASNN